MTRIRPYLSGVLVAVMLLTGQGMAVARGMPGAAGYMQLCTGTGPVMVEIDADGNPTGSSRICPEFALTLLHAIALPEAMAVPIATRATRIAHLNVAPTSGRLLVPGSARDPPVFL